MLYHNTLIAEQVHWISEEPPAFPEKLYAKTRYRQADQPCIVKHLDGKYTVIFDEPQRAITPGQSVVFYQKDECLGGGVIVDYT
jgi:tRNA-specific 2-thiouridylase